MGLSIGCKYSEYYFYCSYGAIQYSRKNWIIATYLYIKHSILSNSNINSQNDVKNVINKFNNQFINNNFIYNFDDYNSISDSLTDDDIHNEMIELFNNYQQLMHILINILTNSKYLGLNIEKYNISYDYIYKNMNTVNYYLAGSDLLGLFHWVIHSDCDGFLSVGQSYDIKELLEKIGRYLCFIKINNFDTCNIEYSVENMDKNSNNIKYEYSDFISNENVANYLTNFNTLEDFKDMEDGGMNGKFYYDTKILEECEPMYNIVKYSISNSQKIMFS